MLTLLSLTVALPIRQSCPIRLNSMSDLISRTNQRLILSFPQTAQGITNPNNSYDTNNIVGGHAASNSIAAYLALLSTGCTATIIGARTLLTAAHCLPDESMTEHVTINAFLSSRNGLKGHVMQVVDYLLAPSSSPTATTIETDEMNNHYDWALLFLDSDIPDTSKRMKVNVNSSVPLTSTYVRAIGYGLTIEGDILSNVDYELRQVDVPVTSKDYCQTRYDLLTQKVTIDYKWQTCAGYKRGGCDSCQGDSGGPIIQFGKDKQPVLVGVVSSGAGCARKGFPGIYIKSAPYEELYKSVVGAELTNTTESVTVKQGEDTDGLVVTSKMAIILSIVGFVVVIVLIAIFIFVTRWFKRNNGI